VVHAEPPPPTAEQIAKWVEQLSDASFDVRQKATDALWHAGKAAEAALLKVADSTDPEVKRRAREVLDKFKWGVYPDTPADVVELITQYQGGDRNGKSAAVRALFDKGSKGCAALVKIAAAEDDGELRRSLFLQITQDSGRAIPDLIADGHLSTLEDLLDLGLAFEPGDAIYQNHAVYWLLRDKLDDRIAVLKARPEADKDSNLLQALTYLYRAKGDLKAAKLTAEKAGRRDLLAAVLTEAADWKALAKLADDLTGLNDVETLGLRCAYYRLAGNGDAFVRTADELRKLGEERADEDAAWLPAKALFLNGRTQDGLDLLAKNGHYKTEVAFDVLTAQLRTKEALEMADKVKNDVGLDLLRARTLYNLGEKDRAQAIFASYAKRVREGADNSWNEKLVEAEFRVGLKEQAFDHCAPAVVAAGAEGNQARLLGAVFPNQRDAAVVWWKFLRQKFANEEPAAVMKRLRGVLEGKTTGQDLEALANDLEQGLAQVRPEQQEETLLALAEVCLAAGSVEPGRRYLEKAADLETSRQAAVRLGDFHAERKEWDRAAARYEQAWKRDKRAPLPMYLRGWAVAQGGNAKEGRRLMDLAHWLPLGDEYLRYEFIRELSRRGQDADARRETELLLATARPGSHYAGEALRQVANEALAKKDFLKAAECHERALLRCFQPSTEFVQGFAYVTVPHLIHRLQARGLMADGKTDAVLREVEFCTKTLPGNIDLAVRLVPELEKAGRKKEAGELFTKTLEPHARLCADFPKSAWAHNNLAWLCVSCRRELDQALEHARLAVELAPDNAGYLDTLAEVHFQRGDKDRAVAAMKKCIAADGKNAYYRKQLQRFEAGDPAKPIPEGGED
jgi:tetratricopeptide (TPR) repeat protein